MMLIKQQEELEKTTNLLNSTQAHDLADKTQKLMNFLRVEIC